MEDTPKSSSEDSKKSDKDEKSSSKKKKLGNKLVANAAEKRRDSDNKSAKSEKPISLVEFFENKSKKEVDKASESEAPTDKMGKDEKALAASAIAEEAAKGIPEHPRGTETDPNIAADLVAAAYYDRLIETGDIEGAAADTAAELDIPADEVMLDETNEATITDEEAESVDEVDESLEPDSVGEIPEDAVTEGVNSELSDTDEGVVFERIAANSPALPPNGSKLLPLPLEAPLGAGTPSYTNEEFNPVNAFEAPEPDTVPKNQVRTKRYENTKPASSALTGGIVGFLVGRRSGRVNTEKKLMPVQKKLEKQVEDLHWQIKAQENKLRRVAVEKIARDGIEIRGPLVVRRAEQVQNVLVAKKIERIENSDQTKKSEQNPSDVSERQNAEQRRRAPEASQLHGAAHAHEHIGHMLVTAAESAPFAHNEKPLSAGGYESKISSQKQQEKMPDLIAERFNEKRIETLNRAELLALSDKIIIDGSSLRQIYETHLIGERGLRRLVAEHLRGGNVKKTLRREIVEREIDFERDPALRDMNPQISSSGSTGAKADNNEELKKLLESASAGFGDSQDQAAFYKARDDYDAGSNTKKQNNHHVADVSLMATIVSLLAVIIILYLWSH